MHWRQRLDLQRRRPHVAIGADEEWEGREHLGLCEGEVERGREAGLHGGVLHGFVARVPVRHAVERDARVLRRHADHQHREPQIESCREPNHCFRDCYRRLCVVNEGARRRGRGMRGIVIT